MPKCFYEIRNSRGGVHSGPKWPQLRPSTASGRMHASETFQWLDTKFRAHMLNLLIGTLGGTLNSLSDVWFLSTPLTAQKNACTFSPCTSVLTWDLKWFDTQQNRLLDSKCQRTPVSSNTGLTSEWKPCYQLSAAARRTLTILHCRVVHPQTLVGD